ncbi:hypothetical protein [Tranquillimonas alkanivorans]|uniref:Uncharacterized protein n=1 Tax=Tranquillimonas alkanivorans TaxID=441119 RepID=A0A1I5TSV1_9RHOB|nr:hypothetical protein [Tranquillimonas alkanivorans]SFP86142.1 hypothetical protein SAMN04488047_11510 [Tranquillimonas alkanivorans]
MATVYLKDYDFDRPEERERFEADVGFSYDLLEDGMQNARKIFAVLSIGLLLVVAGYLLSPVFAMLPGSHAPMALALSGAAGLLFGARSRHSQSNIPYYTVIALALGAAVANESMTLVMMGAAFLSAFGIGLFASLITRR